MLACYQGIASQAIINNLAPLFFIIFQNQFGLSLSRIGFLILLNFGTQLLVDALSVRYADRIGYRPLIVGAHVCCALGLVMMSALPFLLPPYAGLVIAVITYAIGGGLIEVLVSPIADALPGEAKASSMSLLHSFYCWGHVAVVLLTTGALLLLGTARWYVIAIHWAIVPALNIINFLRVPLMPTLSEHERMPVRKLLASPLFLLAMLLMICSGASEQAMSQWASLFAERGLGVTKTLGDLLGPCLFAVLMGLGRTLYGIYGERIRITRALIGCAALCVVCYLVTALSPNPFIALVSCAVTGFSVSLMWPGMISLSARVFTTGGTALFGLLAMGGDIGCAVGPWLTGVVGSATSLNTGLLVAVIFPLTMFIGVAAMQRMQNRT